MIIIKLKKIIKRLDRITCNIFNHTYKGVLYLFVYSYKSVQNDLIDIWALSHYPLRLTKAEIAILNLFFKKDYNRFAKYSHKQIAEIIDAHKSTVQLNLKSLIKKRIIKKFHLYSLKGVQYNIYMLK